ncbi:YqaJ domain-containing protein, partial [Aphis craccivora]
MKPVSQWTRSYARVFSLHCSYYAPSSEWRVNNICQTRNGTFLTCDCAYESAPFHLIEPCDDVAAVKKTKISIKLFTQFIITHKYTIYINAIQQDNAQMDIRLQYGIQNEPLTKNYLETKLGTKILPCVLIADKKLPYLAAKSIKYYTPEEAFHEKKIKCITYKYNDSNFQLKTSHAHYYQIQGQLHIRYNFNSKFCFFFFCIWTHKKVERDDDFWMDRYKSKIKEILHEITDQCFGLGWYRFGSRAPIPCAELVPILK